MAPKEISSDAASPVKNASGTGQSVQYKVTAEKRLVTVKFGKRLAEADLRNYIAALRSNPRFAPSFSEIIDLSAVEEVDLRGEEMMKLADQVDPYSPYSKRAFVVQNALQSHQVKMYRILRASGDKIRTFQSVDAAERWILGDKPGSTPKG